MTVESRVARGAAWLDQVVPGWERKIDLSRLDLADSCQCILGQVVGVVKDINVPEELEDLGYGYMSGYDAIMDTATNAGFKVGHWAHGHGFYVRGGDDVYASGQTWVALLKTRFSDGLLSDETA